MLHVPAGSPSEVWSCGVVFKYRVVRTAVDVKIQSPVRVVAVIGITLQPRAVEARRDAAVRPERPSHGQLVGTDAMERLDCNPQKAPAPDSICTYPVRTLERLGVVIIKRVL